MFISAEIWGESDADTVAARRAAEVVEVVDEEEATDGGVDDDEDDGDDDDDDVEALTWLLLAVIDVLQLLLLLLGLLVLWLLWLSWLRSQPTTLSVVVTPWSRFFNGLLVALVFVVLPGIVMIVVGLFEIFFFV